MDMTRRRELASRWLDGYVHGPAAATEATAVALAKVAAAQAVVLVEGISDQIAVETLAARGGRDLGAEHVVVLPVGGAHAITRYLEAAWSPRSWPAAGGPVRQRRGERRPARPGPGPASARRARGPAWSDWAFTSASRIWRTS